MKRFCESELDIALWSFISLFVILWQQNSEMIKKSRKHVKVGSLTNATWDSCTAHLFAPECCSSQSKSRSFEKLQHDRSRHMDFSAKWVAWSLLPPTVTVLEWICKMTGESFVIRQIDGKGIGVVAIKDIKCGELIISEEPLLVIPWWARTAVNPK